MAEPDPIQVLEERIAAAEPGTPLVRDAADLERYIAESVAAGRHRIASLPAAQEAAETAETAESAATPAPPTRSAAVPKMVRSRRVR